MVDMPNNTVGYQRQAMAMMAGTTAPGSNPATAAQASAVQLLSKAMGHLGGNDITAEFVAPTTPDAPLQRGRRRQEHHRQPAHERRGRADGDRRAGA